jgi:hypothetical protein
MWIEKSRNERADDVMNIINQIMKETPDRFWFCSEQEGIDVQQLHVKLPVLEEDVLYDIRIVTAQLKAARMAAYELGQSAGQRIAVTPSLIDKMGLLREESFDLRNDHDDGILIDIVVDADGITHQVVDDLLLAFRNNGYVPPCMRSLNPMVLARRILEARDNKKLEHYPLI